jgi:GDPmannose 4,6-dehydratase
MLKLVEQDDVFEACIGSGEGFSIENWAQACFDLGGLNWRDYIKDDPKFVSSYDRLVSAPALIQSLGWDPQVDFYQLAEMMVKGT